MEYDLVLMSAVIFVPVLAALPLCFRWLFPRGSDEWMKWWTLLATAVTLTLSICMFIDYFLMTDRTDRGARPGHSLASLLGSRVESAQGSAVQFAPPDNKDWVARVPWIDAFGIDYYLGVDGISLPLILLTTALTFLSMLASWNIERHVRGYCILFLLLETGMLGTFMALDFFLFFIFWEVMLLPMYFLIGVWGGPRREYAAIKFFLYTMLGSVFMLIALLAFYFTDIRDFVPGASPDRPKNSFDIVALHRAGDAAARYLHRVDDLEANGPVSAEAKTKEAEFVARGVIERTIVAGLTTAQRDAWDKKDPAQIEKVNAAVAAQLPAAVERLQDQAFFSLPWFQITMFLLLFICFAIKVPVFPFHTWLPDAHVEAPTPISMILAGVLLKMGGYGIIRVAYPICPWAAETIAWYVCLFGVINIVYGAFAAMAQTDFKKLVAYSSISHMGYVILGIGVWSTGTQYWSWGMNGAMFQMIAHGVSSAGMFFLVGVIYDRAHHRNLDNFRGLYEPMPLYSGISAIIFFAALGLPGLCGFVGEFFVVLAAWNFNKLFAILAALTVVLTAGYVLWTIQRVFLGTNPAYKDYPDITPRELACIIPLCVFAVLLGVLPMLLLDWMNPSVAGLVHQLARVPGW